MLEYDNSAFYYFALTLLACCAVPLSFSVLSDVLSALGLGSKSTARSKDEKERDAKIRKEREGFVRLTKRDFVVKLILSVGLWLIVGYLVVMVSRFGQVNTFDPFAILGISSDASVGDIKKAYRRLSLIYHPDKNIGNKTAEEIFIKIVKAYETLTDEEAKKNLLEFGNPDGRQPMEVSIGLPSMLLANPKVVLVLYLIGMVLCIPIGVAYWYTNSKKFSEKNIMYDSYKAYYDLLQKGQTARHMPEVLAASAEFRQMSSDRMTNSDKSKAENRIFSVLLGKLQSGRQMIEPKYKEMIILRSNVLLHAHMYRLHDELNSDLKTDLDNMLRMSPELISGMLEIAQERRWLDTSMSIIHFYQYLIQALSPQDSPFKQIPYMTSERMTAINSHFSSSSNPFKQFLISDDKNRPGLSDLSESERAEVNTVCQSIPAISVSVKLFVEEEEEDDSGPSSEQALRGDDILEQDVVTVEVKISRENFGNQKSIQRAYAPFFPRDINESYHVILTEKSSPKAAGDNVYRNRAIHAMDMVQGNGTSSNCCGGHGKGKQSKNSCSKEIVHRLQFMAPPKEGDYELEVIVVSDVYVGVEESVPIRFTVLPASRMPAYEPHPEDKALDNEPTLFEQMMAASMDDDSSSDEEDDKDSKETVATRKVDRLNSDRKGSNSDSDEE